MLIDKNITWHSGNITKEDRYRLLSQNPKVVWFTGLSGSGKSTIAVEVEKQLFKENKLIYRLDGDNIRFGLNKDLGFKEEDRIENIRRISEVAKLFHDAGIITLVSFITPLEKMRELYRGIIGKENVIEVYVKADIEVCAKRDPKGLYKKAFNGEIKHFTGISDKFEEPNNPDLVIDTEMLSIEESTQLVLNYLNKQIRWM
ncbi:adenylyl-sulfate kinase [Vulcanibacillus modesticaldus]|uniref:Adenylyl-sulfate kinase n=1 Tax=Vulcanibacillus modesticaldus TaxID=337097 RepID=A0A1D2YW05_9BACI|nr:adenylyl-sulfate kinase [Vulcanibacillus modesticaldus]OEF99882.1 adenylyl-sulfate kinase [Vulcanibacillus modesticaldus]